MANPAQKDPPGVNDAQGLLYEAARQKDWREVYRLLDREGGDPLVELSYSNRSLMHYAAESGDIKVMDALHRRGVPLEGRPDKNGTDVIHAAADKKQVHVLEWLRQQGVDITKKGGTAERNILHYGVSSRDMLLVSYALDMGIDPNEEEKNGNTPLMMLASRYPTKDTISTRLMNLLVDRGGDMNYVNAKGISALHRALQNASYLSNAQILLDMGADMDNPAFKQPIDDIKVGNSMSPYGPTGKQESKEVKAFIKARRELPEIDLDSYFRKEDLFKPNEHGDTPLDNPKTWAQLGEISAVLAKRRQPLERDDFLHQKDDGKIFLQRAIECRSLDKVLPVLAERGQWIEPLDFVAADGKNLNPLGLAAFDYGSIGREVFQPEVWRGNSPRQLKNFYNELPAPLQKQVSNLHQLTSELARQERIARSQGTAR